MPPITLVTPSFNQARFLDETLRCITAQRQHLHEFFVLDGGSTDGSVDVIRRYQSGIDFWTSEGDAGQADAIRKGFARATGDYLMWINSDDVLLPGALAKIQALLDANPKVDAVTGYHVRMDEASRILSAHRTPAEHPAAARRGVHHVIQQTCAFRRSLYEAVGGMDPSLHCVLDTEMWLRMFDANSNWGHVPQYLAGFRQHATAKGSADAWWKQYRAEEQMLRERYPQYCADTLGHRLNLLAYRAGQVVSGRHLRAMLDTRRWRGRTIEDVFGRYGPTDSGR